MIDLAPAIDNFIDTHFEGDTRAFFFLMNTGNKNKDLMLALTPYLGSMDEGDMASAEAVDEDGEKVSLFIKRYHDSLCSVPVCIAQAKDQGDNIITVGVFVVENGDYRLINFHADTDTDTKH